MDKRFLFVTANEYETEVLLKDRDFYDFKVVRSKISTDNAFYNVGKFGCYEVVHFELIDKGSIKTDASALAIYEAIEEWEPDAVILVGIAFGRDNGKNDNSEARQNIGDVLVSKMVADYESGKIKNGNLQSDGVVPESGRQLISVFQHYSKNWTYYIHNQKVKVIMGLILSGDKVIDDETKKSQLFEKFPRAIGGEMEGRGLYSACRKKGIEEWIIVKSICDWGLDKENDKKENQIIASESAVALLKYIFSQPEAFCNLPINENRKDKINSITNSTKEEKKNYVQIQQTGSININGNKSESTFVVENVTINGGINFGRK